MADMYIPRITRSSMVLLSYKSCARRFPALWYQGAASCHACRVPSQRPPGVPAGCDASCEDTLLVFVQRSRGRRMRDSSRAKRRQPDEIKCHVVWGKLFVAEWVSSGAFLGFIFRHGFVKDRWARMRSFPALVCVDYCLIFEEAWGNLRF